MAVPNTDNGGIELDQRPNLSYVRMWGEVDVALRPDAGAALSVALDRELPVVIDTSSVTFIDSTGIAFLVQFYTIGTQEGLDVTLREPPSVVRDVLEMLGCDVIATTRTEELAGSHSGSR